MAGWLLGCSKPLTAEQNTPPVVQPLRIVQVSTASELKSALLDARPGDEIRLADGRYAGKFVVAAGMDGNSARPIVLKGGPGAVLDGGSIQTGYVLHLQSSWWIVRGLTITNGLKGVMTDGMTHGLLDSLTVFGIGEEGIHLRSFSTHNTVRNCRIYQTGLKTPDYGEGVYIGSAKNNWASYSNGNPDRCDSNAVLSCRIGPQVAAESIDIKEGTTGGLISGNYFDATGITGANSADSWIDVKGNGYRIEGNTGTNTAGSALVDGFQVHVAVAGWGNNNEFRNNQCTVNASGYGFLVKLSSSSGTAVGNKVYTNNQVSNAAAGTANIPLSQE